MKRNEKIAVATGVVLLAIAAFFTIGLMLCVLNFGPNAKGSSSVCFAGGLLLYNVYGFSSMLIPVYLLIAAIFCFLPKWTVQRGVYLVSSIIPFFTIAGVEYVCRTLFSGETPALFVLRVSSFFLVSAMLVAIEYLVIGFLCEKILQEEFIAETIAVFEEDKEWKDLHRDSFVEENKTESFNPEVVENSFESEKSSEFEVVLPVEEISSEEVFIKEDSSVVEELVDSEVEDILSREPSDEQSFEHVDGAFFDIDDLNDEDDDLKEDLLIGDSSSLKESDEDTIDDSLVNFEVVDVPKSVAEDAIHVEFESLSNTFDDFDEDEDSLSLDDYYSQEEAAFLQNPYADLDTEADIPTDDKEDEDDGIEDEDDEIDEFVDEKESLNDATVPVFQRFRGYEIPVDGILEAYPGGEYWVIDEKTKQAAQALKETLSEFKIEAEVTGIRKGPVITMFEILPAPGVRLNKIVTLADNIALRLAAQSVRIVAPIPGKHAVGIEIPNSQRAIVGFREIIAADLSQYKKMSMPVILGKKINGDAQIIDLAKTPHLLIAGATGSGKSVCVNTLILSLLYKRSPSDVKMILIDPKIVELKLYNDIPHLLTPVITESKKAFQALQYALCEMERRYALLDGMGVRDLDSYNKRIKERKIATEKLPFIVIIIDEFADLMATTGKELESTIARLCAMSRAVGIHLVLATQRPSIDVITGLIKANIPSRIAFMVASKTDSRIIIDQVGAEKLLGKGDMLYASATDPFPTRIQGTFVSDDEVENVVNYIKQYGPPDYIDDEIFVEEEESAPSLLSDGDDPLYEQALEVVMQAGKASASYVQRRLKIGYNRAARLVEEMEDQGIVGPQNGSKPREILKSF